MIIVKNHTRPLYLYLYIYTISLPVEQTSGPRSAWQEKAGNQDSQESVKRIHTPTRKKKGKRERERKWNQSWDTSYKKLSPHGVTVCVCVLVYIRTSECMYL